MILYYRVFDNNTKVILVPSIPHLSAVRTNYCCGGVNVFKRCALSHIGKLKQV